MLILNKKRITIIACMLLISIYAFAFKETNIENKNAEETLETVATPVSGKTVILDAGHGSPDEGVSLLH